MTKVSYDKVDLSTDSFDSSDGALVSVFASFMPRSSVRCLIDL